MKQITTVTCHDVDGNTYPVSSDQLKFRPAVYAVIIQNNTILLSKQHDGYDFPGGGIELGETTEEALIREVKEETGMEVSVGKILHSNSSFFKLLHADKPNTFVHSIHLYFVCTVTGGELSTEFFDDNEKKYSQMAEWVDMSLIGKIKMYTSVDPVKVLKSAPGF